MGRPSPARLLVVLAGVGLAAAGGAGGCSQDFGTVDSYPILLARAPLGAPPSSAAGGVSPGSLSLGPDGGALVALAGLPGSPGPPFNMVIDTGSPFTI